MDPVLHTMLCSDQGYAYGPLDMPGESLTLTKNVAECQARCANSSVCTHFSYWEPYGHCHLQDNHALRGETASFISGPPSCDEPATETRLYSQRDLLHMERSSHRHVASFRTAVNVLSILGFVCSLTGVALLRQKWQRSRCHDEADEHANAYSACRAFDSPAAAPDAPLADSDARTVTVSLMSSLE